MLTVLLKGEVIPIPKDFSIRLEYKSPVTDFEKIPSSYGLGLSFPINEHTRARFGHPDRYAKARTEDDQKFPGFEVRFSGTLLMAGTLSISSAKGGKYEGTLENEVGVLGENEQQRNLLDFGIFNKDIPWTNSANFNPDDDPYCCFPIINPGFFKEKGVKKKTMVDGPEVDKKGNPIKIEEETEVLSYCFDKESIFRVNKLNDDHTVKQIASTISLIKDDYASGKLTVVSPYLFLNRTIKEALKSVGFYISRNDLEASDVLKNLCIYHNFDITKTQYTINFVEAVNKINPTTGQFEYTGAYKIQQYTRNYPPTIKANQLLPKMSLGDLLLSTQNLLNVCFHFLPDNTVNVYSREKLITQAAVDLDPYFLDKWEFGEKKNVALKFVREHDKQDLVFEERWKDINDRMSDIKEPVADWTELLAMEDPKEGDIRLMTSTNIFYEYKMFTRTMLYPGTKIEYTEDLLGWEEFSIGLQNAYYNYGKKEEEIKTSWSTCYGNKDITLVNQQGNMNSWRAKFADFSPRLLIYMGNNSGGNESDTFSLEYDKKDIGILPRYWKNWNPFWANRLAVQGKFDLPVNMLRWIIYNICRKYRTREGEFFIDKLGTTIYNDYISETDIDGFKIE